MAFRIPYPLQLHIEESQIYKPTENREEIEETKSDSKQKKSDLEFEDLNLKNSYFQSEQHQGTVELQTDTGKEKCHQDLDENHCYDLSGIVVHYGTGMAYGHYWSVTRSPGGSTGNQKWVEHDDSKQRVVEDKDI